MTRSPNPAAPAARPITSVRSGPTLAAVRAAEDMLPEGYHFRILDAYRPIAVQQALWDHYRAQFRREMP